MKPPLNMYRLVTFSILWLFANITNDYYAVATKSRKYSSTENTLLQLKWLLTEGIIQPLVSVVTTIQESWLLLGFYPWPRIDELVKTVAEYWLFSTNDFKFTYYQVLILDEDKPIYLFFFYNEFHPLQGHSR